MPWISGTQNRALTQNRAFRLALLLALCFEWHAACLPAAASAERQISSAREVHSMLPGEAAHRYPVHLRAVLTYYHPYLDPRRAVIFVCDRTGCVFVSAPPLPILSVRAGDLTEITGVTGPGDYASIIEASQIKTIGHPGLPRHARETTMDDLASGRYDTDWIRVQGRVRSIHREPNIVSLVIAAKGGSFGAVTQPEPGVDYDRLVDSLIEITANTAPVFNQRRQMVAVHLFFPSMRQVQVLEPAPPDPFDNKAMSVLDMFRFSSDASEMYRAHVKGTVTLDWPGRVTCIQDEDSPLCMPSTQTTGLPLGSHVDVVGFPAIRSFKPTLEYPVFRLADSSVSAIQPITVTADRTFQDDLDGKLVTVEAELVGRDYTSPDSMLMMRSNGVLFSVVVPREIPQSVSLALRDGSLLRVTGICDTDVNTFSISIGNGIVRPETVKILLRNAGDVALLRAPSWWTPQHALAGFAAIGLVVAVCLAWITVLRHSVKQRTVELRASEDRLRYLSEHDIVTDLPNRILLNDRLSTALRRARRFNGRVGVLLADLDGFKDVNDQMGHRAGDKVLAEVSGRFLGCVRSTDTVARMGGDEFVILLPDLHHECEAEQVASKLAAAVAEPFLIDEKAVRITVSIGVACFPVDAQNEESLIQLADEAMYRAKETGKNRIEVYSGGRASSPV